jgi:hypothetical protein
MDVGDEGGSLVRRGAYGRGVRRERVSSNCMRGVRPCVRVCVCACFDLRVHSTDLPLARGIRLRVRMPLCTYWSMSLYPGMFDPKQDVVPPCTCVRLCVRVCVHMCVRVYTHVHVPIANCPTHHTAIADHEAVLNADGTFDLVVSNERPAGDLGRNWLPAQVCGCVCGCVCVSLGQLAAQPSGSLACCGPTYPGRERRAAGLQALRGP